MREARNRLVGWSFSQGKGVSGSSLSEWVRRASSNTARTDANGEDALKRKLKVVQDKLYQKCCPLECSKVQLENPFFGVCKKYSAIFSGTRALVKRSSNESQRLHKVEVSRQDTGSGELGYHRSNLITEFYTRALCIPFAKWQVDDAAKRLVEEQMMFGVSTNTADAAEAIATIVASLQVGNDAAARVRRLAERHRLCAGKQSEARADEGVPQPRGRQPRDSPDPAVRARTA